MLRGSKSFLYGACSRPGLSYRDARGRTHPYVLKEVSGPWNGRESLVEATPSLKSFVLFYSHTTHDHKGKYIQRMILDHSFSSRAKAHGSKSKLSRGSSTSHRPDATLSGDSSRIRLAKETLTGIWTSLRRSYVYARSQEHPPIHAKGGQLSTGWLCVSQRELLHLSKSLCISTALRYTSKHHYPQGSFCR